MSRIFIVRTNKPLNDVSRDLVQAVCELHRVGVVHTNLVKNGGKDVARGSDGKLRIIDFSMARFHCCSGAASSTLSDPELLDKLDEDCSEPPVVELGKHSHENTCYFNPIHPAVGKEVPA